MFAQCEICQVQPFPRKWAFGCPNAPFSTCGFWRRSVPQPADSDYRRDLSHNTNPVSLLLPASHPTTRLPQLGDPSFLHHIDPFGFQQFVDPEVTGNQGFDSSQPPGDVIDWWYQSDDTFSFFSSEKVLGCAPVLPRLTWSYSQ
ncbi:hypothetical protein BSKO_09716 [Bryopsis sp. KO-2023]|nr:hypothetical protein BSKO_09716 [Bryopsis sp. KO-2023]